VLPKDLTTEEGQQKARAALGALHRQIGVLQQAVEDRTRIIDGLQSTVAVKQRRIEALEFRVEELEEALTALRRRGGDPEAMDRVEAELGRWRDLAMGLVAAVQKIAASIQVRPVEDGAGKNAGIEISPARPCGQPSACADVAAQAPPADEKRCVVPWCANTKRTATGYCVTHHSRVQAHGDPYLVTRRINKVLVLCRETAAGVFEPVEAPAGGGG